MRRRGFLSTLSAALLTRSFVGCAGGEIVTGPILDLPRDRIRGKIVNDVHRYLGIPYAGAPFGQNRFVAPIPKAASEGIFEAVRYGFIWPQTGQGVGTNLLIDGEDCLNLNVWTPDSGAKGFPSWSGLTAARRLRAPVRAPFTTEPTLPKKVSC